MSSELQSEKIKAEPLSCVTNFHRPAQVAIVCYF